MRSTSPFAFLAFAAVGLAAACSPSQERSAEARPASSAPAAAGPQASAAKLVVYKSPTCGCCKNWVEHMEKAGFTVEAHDTASVEPIKTEQGLPPKLASCHTALIDGYVIEGHVPADLVQKLLTERPEIRGLAVPGMPMGSPGMEGFRKDEYDVIAFDSAGNTSVYARR